MTASHAFGIRSGHVNTAWGLVASMTVLVPDDGQSAFRAFMDTRLAIRAAVKAGWRLTGQGWHVNGRVLALHFKCDACLTRQQGGEQR